MPVAPFHTTNHAVMMHHTTIKHVTLEYWYIFKHKKPDCNIILIARKSKKIFQSMKMCITGDKANRKFTTEKYFSRKILIFPISLIFNQNSLIIPRFFSKKESIFKFPYNSLTSLISGRLWTMYNKSIIRMAFPGD